MREGIGSRREESEGPEARSSWGEDIVLQGQLFFFKVRLKTKTKKQVDLEQRPRERVVNREKSTLQRCLDLITALLKKHLSGLSDYH